MDTLLDLCRENPALRDWLKLATAVVVICCVGECLFQLVALFTRRPRDPGDPT